MVWGSFCPSSSSGHGFAVLNTHRALCNSCREQQRSPNQRGVHFRLRLCRFAQSGCLCTALAPCISAEAPPVPHPVPPNRAAQTWVEGKPPPSLGKVRGHLPKEGEAFFLSFCRSCQGGVGWTEHTQSSAYPSLSAETWTQSLSYPSANSQFSSSGV